MGPVLKSTYLAGLPVIIICLVTLAGTVPSLARDNSPGPSYNCACTCYVPANESLITQSIAVGSSGITLACRAMPTVAQEYPICGVVPSMPMDRVLLAASMGRTVCKLREQVAQVPRPRSFLPAMFLRSRFP